MQQQLIHQTIASKAKLCYIILCQYIIYGIIGRTFDAKGTLITSGDGGLHFA